MVSVMLGPKPGWHACHRMFCRAGSSLGFSMPNTHGYHDFHAVKASCFPAPKEIDYRVLDSLHLIAD